MLHFSKMAVVIGMSALFVTAAAQGATGPAMFGTNGTVGPGSNTAGVTRGTGSNTGTVSGNSASYPGWTATGGGGTFSCADVTYNFTAVVTGTATIDPVLSNCTVLVGVTSHAGTVDTPCSWTLSVDNGTFSDATAATSGGTLTTGCSMQVTDPAAGCTLDFPAQSVEGVSWQNVDSSGTSSLRDLPWGSKIVHSVSGLTFTATGTCTGVVEHGTMSLSGTMAVRNVFGWL